MQVCTSLQTDNHASTPSLSFLQAGCPSCCPTNTVKALKAKLRLNFKQISSYFASTVFAVSEADLRGERLKSQVENNNHFTVH